MTRLKSDLRVAKQGWLCFSFPAGDDQERRWPGGQVRNSAQNHAQTAETSSHLGVGAWSFSGVSAFLAIPPRAVAVAPPGCYLIWSGEFDGLSVDSWKWGQWTGNYHDAVNTSSAIFVSGGNVTITTHTSGGTHYVGNA